MKDFQVGDTVRSTLSGLEGTITRITEDAAGTLLHLDVDGVYWSVDSSRAVKVAR